MQTYSKYHRIQIIWTSSGNSFIYDMLVENKEAAYDDYDDTKIQLSSRITTQFELPFGYVIVFILIHTYKF